MKVLEEKRPPREPAQSKTDRYGTCPFVNPYKHCACAVILHSPGKPTLLPEKQLSIDDVVRQQVGPGIPRFFRGFFISHLGTA